MRDIFIHLFLFGDLAESLKSFMNSLGDFLLNVSAGAAALAMAWGGVRYIFSAGDPGRVQQGKSVMLYATIGLIIVLLAKAIVAYIVSTVKA